MRIIKEHDERRNEILDTAEALFFSKGYARTTINDILHQIKIAKGTFYYYFKSKDEVMFAIINRIVDGDLLVARKIVSNTEISVHDKLLQILLSQGVESRKGYQKKELTDQIHQQGNEIMHQQTLAIIIKRLASFLAEVIRQGIDEGFFHLVNVQETIEILLAGAEFIFDSGLFPWTNEEKENRINAFLDLMERALRAEQGSFSNLASVFK